MAASALDNFFGGFGRGVGALPPGRLLPTETRTIKMMLDAVLVSARSLTPLMPMRSNGRSN